MHIQGNQLVPELLLEVSDTLRSQYRYIEHVHEEVSCQKKFKLLFNMAFVFLILIFFIDQRGVSDKHCLLSFFSYFIKFCQNLTELFPFSDLCI